MTTPESTRNKKEQLRHKLLKQRSHHPCQAQDDAAIIGHICSLFSSSSHKNRDFARRNKVSQITPKPLVIPPRIAAYVPHGIEPGGPALVPTLVELVSHTGGELFLPISLPNHHLAWARHDSTTTLSPGPYGIPEPTTPAEKDFSLQSCSLILVPAVAASIDGFRLGRGGGFYDRALTPLYEHPQHPPVITLLYDNEVLDTVPTEAHDMPVDAIITPSAVLSARKNTWLY